MANPFAAAPALPAQAEALAGLPIRARTFERVAELVDWLEAHAGCDDVVSEAWPDGQARADNIPKTCAIWRIPQPSPLHSIFDVEVRADCSTADGEVELEFLEVGLSATVAPGAVRAELTDAVNVGAAPNGYWTVAMTIYGGTGVTTVESVRITPRPLLSPLPEGVLDQVDGDDLVAFGLDALQPDMPLPSARGRHLRDAIRALRQRPRMRFCRSGLWGVQDTGSPAWRTFPLRRHYAAADWSPSPAARAPWTAWAYVEPDALKTTQVVALVHEGVEGGHGFATDVPPDPAQAPVWVKLAPAPRPIADPLPFVGRFGGLVGFNVGSVSGQTTAGLLSATIWGPP